MKPRGLRHGPGNATIGQGGKTGVISEARNMTLFRRTFLVDKLGAYFRPCSRVSLRAPKTAAELCRCYQFKPVHREATSRTGLRPGSGSQPWCAPGCGAAVVLQLTVPGRPMTPRLSSTVVPDWRRCSCRWISTALGGAGSAACGPPRACRWRGSACCLVALTLGCG